MRSVMRLMRPMPCKQCFKPSTVFIDGVCRECARPITDADTIEFWKGRAVWAEKLWREMRDELMALKAKHGEPM